MNKIFFILNPLDISYLEKCKSLQDNYWTIIWTKSVKFKLVLPMLKPIQTNLNQVYLFICNEDKHKTLLYRNVKISCICLNVPNIYKICDIYEWMKNEFQSKLFKCNWNA